MIETILTTVSTGIAGMECKLAFESIERSIENNTSVLQLKKVYFKRPETGQTLMTGTTEIRLGGVLLYTIPWRGASIYPETAGQWNAITGSGAPDADGRVVKTGTLAHEADGTLSLAVTVSGGFSWDEYNYSDVTYHQESFSAQGTVSVTRIPRASKIVSQSCKIGGDYSYFEFVCEAALANATHDLSITLGTSTKRTVQLFTGKTSIGEWSLRSATSHSDLAPTSGSVHAAATLTTKLSGSTIGTYLMEFDIPIDTDVVPAISATLTDAEGKKATFGKLVQNVSRLSIAVTASSPGSTIASIKTYFDGAEYSGSTVTTGKISQSGTLTGRIVATDGRGRTAEYSFTEDVYEYEAPKVSLFQAYRSRSDGTQDEQGAYIRGDWTGGYSSLGSQNSLTASILRRTSGSTGSWTSAMADGGSAVFPASSDTAYEVKLVLADLITETSQTVKVGTVYSTVDFLPGGKGVTLGGVATREGFVCNMPADFVGGLSVGGVPLEDYIRSRIG